MQAKLQSDDAPVPTVIAFCGSELHPMAEGALWWPARKTLIVSDLHLEKGSSYARGGQHLPPYDTRTTLGLVKRLVSELGAQTVISLGDSFHDPKAFQRLCEHDVTIIRELTSQTDWIWVEGNHDPDPPAHLGGRAVSPQLLRALPPDLAQGLQVPL